MDELIEILEDIKPDVDYEGCENLIDGHYLDSLSIISLIAEIEDAFDVTVPAVEVVPANFNSVKAMWSMIERLQEGRNEMDLPSLLMAGSLDTLTSYFSVAFLAIFLPVSVVVYAVIPQKARKYFLLIASFAFFWLISGQLIAYLCLIIMGVHYFGLWLDRIQTQKSAALKAVPKEEKKALKKVYLHRSRRVLLFAAVLMIGGLLVIKYSPFFTTNVNSLLLLLNIPIQFDIPSYIMPIGISFFTLQAVSYLFDVYRGLIKADDNILRLALFMSFFPQIVEACRICRYGQTANQLWNVKQIEFENLKLGAVRILFGLMKKLVIADRLIL